MSAASDAGTAMPKLPVSHHNMADQARRAAVYCQLRAADDADKEHKVYRYQGQPFTMAMASSFLFAVSDGCMDLV